MGRGNHSLQLQVKKENVANDDKMDDAKGPYDEAAVLDEVKVESIEVIDVEMKDEKEKTESDDAEPPRFSDAIDRSIK